MRRRTFLRATAFAALTAASARRVLGSDKRVRLGLVGCGVRGTHVGKLMAKVPDTAFVAACDVYDPNAAAAAAWIGNDCPTTRDFRRILDRNDVDAVVVATPDHWHAIIAVLACRAGKDVYVEKPMAHNVREGRAIVAATRMHQRVVQVGTQHRSAEHYRIATKLVRDGGLGRVHFVRLWNYTNQYPLGHGKPADAAVPDGLDWDLYLGPAPKVTFNRGRFLNTFRWFWDYAGGLVTDFGTHRLDTMHQIMGADTPTSVSASGGRFALDDGGETPDVLVVTYEYPGFVVSYECSTINGQGTGGRTPGRAYYRARGADDRPHGEAFYGTSGTLFSDRIGCEVVPEPKSTTARRDEVGRDATDTHVANFIDCVRSRRDPVATVEIGQTAATAAHLANVAYRTGRKLRWDAAKEVVVGDAVANTLLGRAARKPWDVL